MKTKDRKDRNNRSIKYSRILMGSVILLLVAVAAGLLLGWQKLILAILLASVIGSIVLVVLNRVRKQDRDTEYPFGPFIVGGMAVAILFGAPILKWYLALLLG